MRISLYKCWIAFWMFLFGLGMCIANAQASENKIALVIGNALYQNLPILKNAKNDAVSVAHALSKKGFTVFLSQDADNASLKKALAFVSERASAADQILIYYAGHSVVRNGVAELLAVDTKIGDQSISPLTMTTTDILKYFDYPFAQKAIILDACLELATDSYGEDQQSLNLPQALGLESLLVFATSIGHVAYDGAGSHSIFTGALLDHMIEREFDLQSAIQTVRKDVIRTSQTYQTPVSISTLTHPYYLTSKNLSPTHLSTRSDLIQSYSSSGYADKPLLNQISIGINPRAF